MTMLLENKNAAIYGAVGGARTFFREAVTRRSA